METSNNFGFGFAILHNQEQALEIILNAVKNGIPKNQEPFVTTPNAAQIVGFSERKNNGLAKRIKRSFLVIADGQPIVWLSKLKGKSIIPVRLCGSDLFPLLLQTADTNSIPYLVICADSSISKKLNEIFVSGVYVTAPILNKSNSVTFADAIAKTCIEQGIKIVVVGLGFPVQEELGFAINDKIIKSGGKSPIICFFGASAEFYLGMKKRAPKVFQKIGLEWFYRLITEPRRLWKRYLIGNFKFLLLACKDYYKK